MEMGMDFKEFQKIMNDIMRDEAPREEKKCKCECGGECECPKEKDKHMEDLHKLIDDLMMELGFHKVDEQRFHKVDEQPRSQTPNMTPKVKTIKCCPVCYGGNLVQGMKLYKKVADESVVKFYEVPVTYCPTCGRKLGEDK